MRIGEAAKRLGLNPRTLRYYERIGLLPYPERTESGYRSYSAADVERVTFVRKAQFMGLSLGEIREITAFRDLGAPPCGYVRGLLERKRAEVQGRIAVLQELEALMEVLVERAAQIQPGGPEEGQGICHLLEAPLLHSVPDLRGRTSNIAR